MMVYQSRGITLGTPAAAYQGWVLDVSTVRFEIDTTALMHHTSPSLAISFKEAMQRKYSFGRLSKVCECIGITYTYINPKKNR